MVRLDPEPKHFEVFKNIPGDTLSLGEVERRHIARVLAATHGNKTMAARILGIDRKTLHRKLVQYARSSRGYENDAAAHHG